MPNLQREKTTIAGDWPPEGLEAVERCPVCGSADRAVLTAGLPDRVFRCAPGVWTYYRCRQCRSAFLDPRPTQASLGLAYTTYYTHEETVEKEAKGWRRWRLAWQNGYLNRRYGYALQPAWGCRLA